MRGCGAVLLLILLVALAQHPVAAQQVDAPDARERMRVALWGDAGPSAAALAELERRGGASVPDGSGDARAAFLTLEEILREGPPLSGDTGISPVAGDADPDFRMFPVAFPDGREIPVFVRLPPGYRDTVPHPVIFAMHGGPTGSAEGAIRGAAGMVEVWRAAASDAGWIVVAPAMTHVRARGPRTETRLPYEVLRTEQAVAVLDAAQRRFRIDPDRIVSTGISLGSNFSIAYGAAIPDRFAAIVPVSTEGDSREHLLRNLQHVPTYVLEGTQDRNIRGISGPRALGDILARFAYDVTYREFSDRAHEGFQELYPDVLRWLAARPRDPWPAEVLRVPHDGIMPIARRVFWIESATRQGLVRARVAGDNHIDVVARWTGSVTVYLHDRLVDLDRPVRFTVNGVAVDAPRARRSLRFAIEQARQHRDAGRAAAAVVQLAVPQAAATLEAAEALSAELTPVHPEGRLSFWEYYAVNALHERVPTLGLRGREVALPPAAAEALRQERTLPAMAEQVGIGLTEVDASGPFGDTGLRPGDLLLELGGEPFFRDQGGLDAAFHWLVRELTDVPRDFPIVVWRDGALRSLNVTLRLGEYQPAD